MNAIHISVKEEMTIKCETCGDIENCICTVSYKEFLEMEKQIHDLREALKWYVDNDDTMNTKYNEPWLEGKRRAMKLLGMEEDDDTL